MIDASHRDRLSELATEQAHVRSIRGAAEDGDARLQHMCQRGVQLIRHNTKAIRALEQRSRSHVSSQKHAEINRYLDEVMVKTRKIAKTMSERLKKEKARVEAMLAQDPGSMAAQMKQNVWRSNSGKFTEAMADFEDAAMHFRNTLKKRITRQARIVNSDIDDEAIDKLLDSEQGSTGGVFELALAHNVHLVDAIDDIEQQRDGMKRIQEGVMEIRELFDDMAMLVDIQQETLDNIEHNVVNATQFTQKAEEMVQKAEGSQRSARKRQWMIFGVCAFILILIIIMLRLSS